MKRAINDALSSVGSMLDALGLLLAARVAIIAIIVAFVASVAGALLFSCGVAQASPPLELVQALPATGPSFMDTYSVSCATSATSLAPTGYLNSAMAIECSAPESGETGATTLVAIGDSAIADPATGTRNSPVICGSGCNRAAWSGNAKQAYCRADSGTVTLYCAALIPSLTAP